MAQDAYLTIDGRRVRYLALGAEKKTVLFLHGWGGSAESFRALLAPVHALGYSVIALDFPSFGDSDPAPDSGWDTRDYAAFLRKFLAHFPDRDFSVYAHSFGGRVICRLLLQTPDLLDRLILSGSAGIVLPLTLRQRLARILSLFSSAAKKILGEKLVSRIGAKLSGSHDWADANPAQKATLKKVFVEKDFRDDLSRITLPTLLLWGAHDSYTPLAAGRVFAQKIPNSRLVVFEDGRHGLHRTHVEQIMHELTTFLK